MRPKWLEPEGQEEETGREVRLFSSFVFVFCIGSILRLGFLLLRGREGVGNMTSGCVRYALNVKAQRGVTVLHFGRHKYILPGGWRSTVWRAP